jgi:hypothetical protein
VGFRIVHVALGVMVELVKLTLAAKDLRNHIRVALLEHSVTFQNLFSCDCHRLEFSDRQFPQIDHVCLPRTISWFGG